jgi:hypothetical protein
MEHSAVAENYCSSRFVVEPKLRERSPAGHHFTVAHAALVRGPFNGPSFASIIMAHPKSLQPSSSQLKAHK